MPSPRNDRARRDRIAALLDDRLQTGRWGKLAEQHVHLFKRARAQEALARQVEQSGSTQAALELLEQHVQLLQDEHALLQDPAAVARLGLDAHQVDALRAGNDGALADTHSQSFEIMKLRFHGLEPIASNGLVWSGTRAQIDAALGESGAAATHPGTGERGRRSVRIAGREITFIETDLPPSVNADVPDNANTASATSGAHAPATAAPTSQPTTTGPEPPKSKPRVTEPVKGLFDGVKTDAKISDWQVDDHVTVEPDGTKVAFTQLTTPDGKSGYVERAYNPKTKQFEMRNAFLEGLPAWVNEGGPGLDPRGIPTVHYVTLRQMKLLGVKYGGYRKVKMSTIQNVRGVIEFNALLSAGMEPNTAILKTHSVQYGETTIQQSGERIVRAEVDGGQETPLRDMLDWYERNSSLDGPIDPTIVAKHDELIAKYGKGVITRDTKVRWDYNIYLDVAPFDPTTPQATSP